MMLRAMTAPWMAQWAFRLRRPVLQTAAIVAACAAAVLFGLVAATQRFEPAFLMIPPLGGLAFLFWRRGGMRYEPFILAIVLSGGLINFVTLPTGSESRIVISLVLSAALTAYWLLTAVMARRLPYQKDSPVNAPILAFAAASLVAFIWSTLFRDALVWAPGWFPLVQTASLGVNLILVMLVLLVADQMRKPLWLKLLTATMLGMGTLYLLLAFTGSPLHRYILNNGARGLFGAWVALLAYALVLFDARLAKGIRALLLLLVALLVYHAFWQGRSWVSGWLPLGIGCVVITWLRSRRLFVVLGTVGLVYLALNFDYYYTNIVLGEEAEGSGTHRVAIWQTNFAHIGNHPLFGSGPAGYAVYYMSYHPDNAYSSHNNYFDILAQTGVVGFAAFLWLLGSLIRVGYRVYRLTHGRRTFEEAFAVATFAGCFAVLVAMFLGDWVLPFAYNQTISGFDHALYTWTLLGAMTGLDIELRREPPLLAQNARLAAVAEGVGE